MQFIAADPGMLFTEDSWGEGATQWGIWYEDPGPRGVNLNNAVALEQSGQAPAGWEFDSEAWWLEEHGLIMESPLFPLPNGRYRLAFLNGGSGTIELTKMGDKWDLEGDHSLYEVTHLPCRAAVYSGENCLPTNADQSDFPVTPGAVMPDVDGCSYIQYAVLFISETVELF